MEKEVERMEKEVQRRERGKMMAMKILLKQMGMKSLKKEEKEEEKKKKKKKEKTSLYRPVSRFSASMNMKTAPPAYLVFSVRQSIAMRQRH